MFVLLSCLEKERLTNNHTPTVLSERKRKGDKKPVDETA